MNIFNFHVDECKIDAHTQNSAILYMIIGIIVLGLFLLQNL